MEIKPIHTNDDYESALQEINLLFDAKPGTAEGDKLEVLTILVEEYEDKHYSVSLPDPIEAIEYHMERLDLTRRDLEQYIGGAPRVSEILNRKRPLNLRMIRNLHRGLGISLEVLFQEYDVESLEQNDEADFLSIFSGIKPFELSVVLSADKTYPKTSIRSQNLLESGAVAEFDRESSSSAFYSNYFERIASAQNATERIIQ